MGKGGIGEEKLDGVGSDIDLEGINSVEVVGFAKIAGEVPRNLALVSVGILGEG